MKVMSLAGCLPMAEIKPSKNVLDRLYHGEKMSAYDIGDRYSVSDATVFRWMKGFGIKSRRMLKREMGMSGNE